MPDNYRSSSDSKTQKTDAFWSMLDLGGDNYYTVLKRFHEFLAPTTYLEIGVDTGAALTLSKADSIAIDPCFRFSVPIMEHKRTCHLFQMTSDEFFRRHDPTEILSNRPVDMAFLDGMHWFEFLLRDLMNVEKACRKNSVILMHDCVPVDSHVGRRLVSDNTWKANSAHNDWWAGDVWKILPILLKYRKDLKLSVLDAHPTGLVVITNLDPTNNILHDNYFEIANEFKDATLSDMRGMFVDQNFLIKTSEIASHNALSARFYI